MDTSEKKKPFTFGQKTEDKDKKEKKDKSRHSLPNALQKTNDALVTPQTDDHKETSSKDEKKSRRLSGTHHPHHHEEHDKKYYKSKYENENKLRVELAEVVKKLNIANAALLSEIESLKSQANTIKPQTSTQPDPVSFAKPDDNLVNLPQANNPSTENPIDNSTLNTPKSTSEPATSYWDSLSSGLGNLYNSYMPNFSGMASKIPMVPRIFEPVSSHHDPVTKPKI